MSATRAQVVEYLRAKGNAGASFSEIQRYVCSLNGLDYNSMVLKPVWNGKEVVKRMVRQYRGYWCTNLCGLSSPYAKKRVGILEKYCVKKDNGRYVLKDFYGIPNHV
jgi:hypothetical protein